jgi:hypothetical protein
VDIYFFWNTKGSPSSVDIGIKTGFEKEKMRGEFEIKEKKRHTGIIMTRKPPTV